MAEDLNLDLEVRVCETMREETKLAMSSRNSYLTKDEKSEAAVLYEALTEGKKMITDYKVTDASAVMKFMENFIKRKSSNLMLQYLAITDNYLMQEIEDLKNYEGELVISLAAYLGKTRLIDNIIFSYK
jgi:pantoate--beta-alanine ligase